MTKIIENLIIGAGPAGLAVAGRMRHANMDFTILEKSQTVGNSWRNHYDRLHLHTVKQLSHLPHLPFPNEYPTYVSKQQLVDYLEQYANHFSIHPKLGEEVVFIKKSGKNWCVEKADGNKYFSKNVIVTTGLNRIPNIPTWKGQENFKGEITHSANYKNPKPYLGQKTLVIGMGNTGAEIALDLSNHDVETYISVRSPITLVPRDLNGRPVQLTAKKLEKIPFGLGDWIGSQVRKIYFGNVKRYGLEISKEHPAKILRETGKTPVIDIGTIKAIKSGKVKVLRAIDHFTETGVKSKNGQHVELDKIILATGFRGGIESLIENGDALLDSSGCPKTPIAEGHHRGLYFVGFDNYKLGGILGTIFNDSNTAVSHIS